MNEETQPAQPEFNLEDDTPLVPACPLQRGDDEGPCEACQ